jgi:dihydroorotate dehydrogenase electron transfer subunit
MVKIGFSEIISNNKIGPDIFRMRLDAPEQAKRVRAGQILHIKCGEATDMVLRRPISVCLANPEKGTMDIVYQIKGKGTHALSRMKRGDDLDYLGPVGNYYEISSSHKRIAVVGGGIGIFPLLEVLNRYNRLKKGGAEIKCDTFLGFRTIDTLVLEEDFKKLSNNVSITTDDGSYGRGGLVTVPFTEAVEKQDYDIVYACGPGPMIKALATIVNEKEIPCQVSLEQRMGCGIGACLSCACQIMGSDGTVSYKQVCKDGPVFWSKEVIW